MAKTFKVSRAYVYRLNWEIQADTKEDALKSLNDPKKTPQNDIPDWEWLGPLYLEPLFHLADSAQEIHL